MKELLEQLGFKDESGVYLPMLSEFVNEAEKSEFIHSIQSLWIKVFNYTKFITQPLTKGMFIPCDEEGNVLEKPKAVIELVKDYPVQFQHDQAIKRAEQYQQAKERVLFECPYMVTSRHNYETIEQAINNGVKLYLK